MPSLVLWLICVQLTDTILTYNLTGKQRAATVNAQNELRQLRSALTNLKQEHAQMKVLLGKEIQGCERQIAVRRCVYFLLRSDGA